MHPEQFPPGLSNDDWFLFNWYRANATGFVRDFGMMSRLIDDLNIDSSCGELVLYKLSLIHQGHINKREKENPPKND